MANYRSRLQNSIEYLIKQFQRDKGQDKNKKKKGNFKGVKEF